MNLSDENNDDSNEKEFIMLKDGINGFCMALADSVPGVSGGTIAFIMGFYDEFIGSVNDLAFGKMKEKKAAVMYLARLGAGWAAGMAVAVVLLSALFESHIYVVTSLFFGFILGAVLLIAEEEKACLRERRESFIFCMAGLLLVVAVTMAGGKSGGMSMDLAYFSAGMAVRLFLIGMAAVSAMFLPGISGSTLLLIFGAYIPVITAVRGVLSLDFSYIPCLLFFGCGVLAGAVTVVKAIKACLERYRPQTVYMILGMMIGSLYAVGMGPTTLDIPQAPLSIGTFHLAAAVAGVLLVFGIYIIKERQADKR